MCLSLDGRSQTNNKGSPAKTSVAEAGTQQKVGDSFNATIPKKKNSLGVVTATKVSIRLSDLISYLI